MPTSELDRTILAERLKQSREYLDLSQEEVAKALGLPRAAISLIESGQRKVDAIELKNFATLYQRSVSYFTGEVATAPVPEDVAHLARTATKLSERDRQELARFAEFLTTRPGSGSADAK
jgi:transcriptional regulator with XRE-family HTH domain